MRRKCLVMRDPPEDRDAAGVYIVYIILRLDEEEMLSFKASGYTVIPIE